MEVKKQIRKSKIQKKYQRKNGISCKEKYRTLMGWLSLFASGMYKYTVSILSVNVTHTGDLHTYEHIQICTRSIPVYMRASRD